MKIFIGIFLSLSSLNLFAVNPYFNIHNKSGEDLFIFVINPKAEKTIKQVPANGFYEYSIAVDKPTKIFLYKKKVREGAWDNLSSKLKQAFSSQKDEFKHYEPLCAITFAPRVHEYTLIGQSTTYSRTIYIKYKPTGDKKITPQEGYGITGKVRWTQQKYNLGNNVRLDEIFEDCVPDAHKK